LETTYEYSLSVKGIKELKSKIQNFKQDLSSEEFIYYLCKKCYDELNQVTSEKLNSDDDGMYFHTYRTSHQKAIIDNDIYLWNETMIDLSSLSEETRAKYPSGLSLAKVVEYGTGIVGANSEASKVAKDWQYDVNNHGNKGWFYVDSSGSLRWSKGIHGRLIFYETKRRIEEKINQWVNEYFQKKLGE
jgi:hypothetical protein